MVTKVLWEPVSSMLAIESPHIQTHKGPTEAEDMLDQPTHPHNTPPRTIRPLKYLTTIISTFAQFNLWPLKLSWQVGKGNGYDFYVKILSVM